MQKLFVYGTLKRGCSNHHFLLGQTYLGDALTKPCYRMVNLGGYPGLVLDEAAGIAIKGELWEIDADCLTMVDFLEDVANNLYARSQARLAPPHEALEDVILYLFQRDPTSFPDVGNEWPLPANDSGFP